jgi:cell division septal protein FtsQ
MKEIRNKTHRASIRSPRVLELKKKNRKHLNVKLGIFLFLFLLVLIGAVFLLRWSSLAITNIHVYGNRIVPIEKIQESVKEELRGYYLWVIPKTNFM